MSLARICKPFKGTITWDGFFSHFILSRIERNFFHVVFIFTGLGQDLTHLAHKENKHSEIFSVRQAKNCILFSYGSDIRCHLTWLKYWPYKLISSRKILAHSPNSLKEAKVRQKKFKILILYLGHIDMFKKTISRYCSFKEARNRFPAWRAGTTTLFDIPARRAT